MNLFAKYTILLPFSKKVLIIVGIIFITYYGLCFHGLFSKSYEIHEDSLFKLDTFKLQSRAYTQSSGGVRNSNYDLVFKSTNGYSFAIDKFNLLRDSDRQQLEDTFMYHETKFVPYTDQKIYERYRASKLPIYIPVYQISVGGKKYINISDQNFSNRNSVVLAMLMPLYLLGISIVFFIKGIQWTDKKVLICIISAFIGFIVVLMLSLILT